MESIQFSHDEDNSLIGEDSSARLNNGSSYFSSWIQARRCLQLVNTVLSKLWEFYIILNTKTITAVALLLLVIGLNMALFFVAVLTHPVQVDYSLNAFEVHDHKIARPLDSLIAAKLDETKSRQEEQAKKIHVRKGRSTNPDLVLQSQYKQKWKLDIIYLAKDGDVFTEGKLEFIHKIEKNLMKHPKFQDFCWKTNNARNDFLLNKTFHGCMPPNSLIDFFYRTNRFDGQGRKLSDISETLDYLLTKLSTFWYVDGKFSADNKRSKMLRSQLHFGIPLKGYTDGDQTLKQQHDIFKNFLVKYVEQLGKASSE